MVLVKIKKLNHKAKILSYAYPGDAGLDLYSCEDYLLQPGERHTFGLGIALEIPFGYAGLIWDKSGLAAKHGLTTLAGVIDANYRGECKVVLINTSQEPYQIKEGDKIAQLLIQKVEEVKIKEVKKLSETSRKDGGFGSSGR